MSLDFQDLCDLTSEIENKDPGDFRGWFYLTLMSAEVRASLFDETIPDRVSLERLSRRSPLAASVVAEFTGRADRTKNLDAVNTVVGMLNSLNEITYQMGLKPEVVAAAEPTIWVGYQALCDLYRVLAGLPMQSIEDRLQRLEKKHPELAEQVRFSYKAFLEIRPAIKEHGDDVDRIMPDLGPFKE